jgi:hypothetical protein
VGRGGCVSVTVTWAYKERIVAADMRAQGRRIRVTAPSKLSKGWVISDYCAPRRISAPQLREVAGSRFSELAGTK